MTEVIVWPGWVGGIAVGLYALLQLGLSGNPLGVSTSYGNVCGLCTRTPFFHAGQYAELNNWRLWFFIGLPLGGLVAALTSPGAIEPSFSLGALYDTVIPQSLWARALVLFAGGLVMGYGARMAGGCTSGHSIAGLSMLNPPSLLASVGFFAGGIASVQLLFRVLG